MENHGGMEMTEEDPSTKALWQSYQHLSVSKQEERAKGMMDLALQSIFVHTFK
jgi:hypothetical protein